MYPSKYEFHVLHYSPCTGKTLPACFLRPVPASKATNVNFTSGRCTRCLVLHSISASLSFLPKWSWPGWLRKKIWELQWMCRQKIKQKSLWAGPVEQKVGLEAAFNLHGARKQKYDKTLLDWENDIRVTWCHADAIYSDSLHSNLFICFLYCLLFSHFSKRLLICMECLNIYKK